LYRGFLETPIGPLEIKASVSGLIFLDFLPPERCGESRENLWVAEAKRQLQEYFSRKRQSFNLPLQLKGTEFQLAVWKAVLKIPYGETRTYQEIACLLGKPGGSQAVGQALKSNPLPIFIPCHRVVGRWDEGGFKGGKNRKLWLLSLERAAVEKPAAYQE